MRKGGGDEYELKLLIKTNNLINIWQGAVCFKILIYMEI